MFWFKTEVYNLGLTESKLPTVLIIVSHMCLYFVARYLESPFNCVIMECCFSVAVFDVAVFRYYTKLWL